MGDQLTPLAGCSGACFFAPKVPCTLSLDLYVCFACTLHPAYARHLLLHFICVCIFSCVPTLPAGDCGGAGVGIGGRAVPGLPLSCVSRQAADTPVEPHPAAAGVHSHYHCCRCARSPPMLQLRMYATNAVGAMCAIIATVRYAFKAAGRYANRLCQLKVRANMSA